MNTQKHKYSDLTPDQYEEHFSNFLIDSWSYSKVATFTRNEKDFEMRYVYREDYKISASSVSGSAYHEALKLYFECLKQNVVCDLTTLNQEAFEYIESIHANEWKLQKTTPTVENCIEKAFKNSTILLNNFYAEKSIYENDIEEVLFVEERFNEWISLNGVDLPLPCHAVIDLVYRSKDNKIVVLDHKSKSSYTDEKDAKFVIGKQAITYVKVLEARTGLNVDMVCFIENKASKNKDGSSQLKKIDIELDKDIIRLYEAMLYEPIKRMTQAVSDPDYVYITNDNDSFVDKAEIYQFWTKTMIAEVEDFNIQDSKKELIQKRLKKIRDASISSINPKIISEFNKNAAEFIQYNLNNKNMTSQEKIEHILRTFGIVSKVQHTFSGYSSNTFLLDVNAGIPLSKIHRHKLDIAAALNVGNIRIMKDLFVHEGKSYLAIESSKKREDNLLFDIKYLTGVKIPIGLDNFGNTVVWDLENNSTPHMLVCGATGSGKSVCLKSTIEYAKHAGINDIIIFDPKFEFTKYSSKGISVLNDIKDIELEMRELVEEMQERVKSGINSKKLIIFDEFADAVASSKKGKELDIIENIQIGTYAPKKVKGLFGEHTEQGLPKMAMRKVGEFKSLEENLKILLQKGRSTGIRIVAATQRASVKVITGDAKVNFPVQVCFRVPKEVDSKVVIDESGAEVLYGMGDGLIKSPEYLNVIRFQGFFKP